RRRLSAPCARRHPGARGRRARENRRPRLHGHDHRRSRRCPRCARGHACDTLGRGIARGRCRRARGHGGLRARLRAGPARPGIRGLMAKPKTIHTCTECGGQSTKWQGQCPHCNAWNTMVETVVEALAGAGKGGAHRFASVAGAASEVISLAEVEAEDFPRLPTLIGEFDRVLGGGLVEGGVVLIGGDPGSGKSTLLLQAAARLAEQVPVLYVTGEESAQQVALRAKRLAVNASKVRLLTEIELEKIQATLASTRPRVAVVDSIQTLYSAALTSAPGSVAQVRECAAQLTRMAKQTSTTIVFVGHVTKEGALAGPRVLEHMVDTVLYFEGETHTSFRLIRAFKNRYGAVNEIGVFAMTEKGLREVANPSALFL